MLENGEFVNEGRGFRITTAAPPRPWLNYMWNDQFLSIVSQTAQGRALQQDEQGRRVNLVSDRRAYLLDVDSGEWFSAAGLPVDEAPSDFRCTHEPGCTTIEQTHDSLASRWRIFVPRREPCELWTFSLRNVGDRPRRLKVILCFHTNIPGQHEGSLPAAHAAYDDEMDALIGSNVVRFGSWYSHETVGRTEDGFFTIDAPVSGYDACKRAFTGAYGSYDRPDALVAGRGCSNSICEFESITFALQTTVELAPGESRRIDAIAGAHRGGEHIAELKERFFAEGAIDSECQAVLEDAIRRVAAPEIRTPEDTFNLLFNRWLKHQLRFNATWARVYFNGFRDLCQDAANYAAVDFDAAWAKFMQVLAHQHHNGLAPRAWCEGELIEQDYSDSPVWIALAAATMVREAGRAELLHREAPFWEGGAASVYEHVRRANEYLWNDRGRHGLSKMHSGDWNDVMNGVGPGGEGESVWLSMALHLALLEQAFLADLIEQTDDAAQARGRAAELAGCVEEHAWDGAWYRRAYTDAGDLLGSAENDEARCFLNPQCWAVISGVASQQRAVEAMRAVDERLDSPIGCRTIDTPYTRFRQDVGFVSAIRAGENVNAGIYVHANVFKAYADCLLGRGERAWESLVRILPFGPARNVATAEPFTIPNSYYAEGPGGLKHYRYGEAGAGWITGSAGWLVTVVIQGLFGLKPTMEGLEVRPCLPPQWTDCRLTRTFRNSVYRLRYLREAAGPGNRLESIEVNGKPIDGPLLPHEPGQTYDVIVRCR